MMRFEGLTSQSADRYALAPRHLQIKVYRALFAVKEFLSDWPDRG